MRSTALPCSSGGGSACPPKCASRSGRGSWRPCLSWACCWPFTRLYAALFSRASCDIKPQPRRPQRFGAVAPWAARARARVACCNCIWRPRATQCCKPKTCKRRVDSNPAVGRLRIGATKRRSRWPDLWQERMRGFAPGLIRQ